jgi:hypothetical protein
MVTAAVVHTVVKQRAPVFIQRHAQSNSVQVSGIEVEGPDRGARRKPDDVIELQQHPAPPPDVGKQFIGHRPRRIDLWLRCGGPYRCADAVVAVHHVHFPLRREGGEQALPVHRRRVRDMEGVV